MVLLKVTASIPSRKIDLDVSMVNSTLQSSSNEGERMRSAVEARSSRVYIDLEKIGSRIVCSAS